MIGGGIEMELLAAALVAGLLNLDSVQVGNFMLSRPVITGPLVGAVMGEPLLGLWIGALVEIIWLTVLPIGNFVPPDSQVAASAAVIAGVVWKGAMPVASASLGMDQCPEKWAALSVLAVAFGVPVGMMARFADVKIRERSETIARNAEAILETGRNIYTSLLILQALAETYVKSVILAAGAGVAALLMRPLVNWVLTHARVERGLWAAQFLLPVVGLSFLLHVLGFRERWYYFFLGIGIVIIARVLGEVAFA